VIGKISGQPKKIVLETRPQKYPTQKRAGGIMDRVVERLPSKHEFKPLYHQKKKVS
jgi:hypothetical protein